jgi:hypothetical protein
MDFWFTVSLLTILLRLSTSVAGRFAFVLHTVFRRIPYLIPRIVAARVITGFDVLPFGVNQDSM